MLNLESSASTFYTNLPTDFSMRGLWPADSNGTAVVRCSKVPVEQSVIDELRPELEKAWPSVVLGRNEDELWKHEWLVRGTCSPLGSAPAYFISAIRLVNRVKLLDALESQNTIPSMTVTYTKDAIIKAVQGLVGADNNVYIRCRNGWLREIYVCVDKLADKYVSCPSKTVAIGGCPDNIIIPTPYSPLPQMFGLEHEEEGSEAEI